MENYESQYRTDEQVTRTKAVAAFLRTYRILNGLRQEDIYESGELSRSSVIRLETAKPVSFKTICKYATALNLPISDVFFEID